MTTVTINALPLTPVVEGDKDKLIIYRTSEGKTYSITPNSLNNSKPVFRATLSTNQSITASTLSKINFNTETFDPNSFYDSSAFKFQPQVAGYYKVGLQIDGNQGSTTSVYTAHIYKNGVTYSSFKAAFSQTGAVWKAEDIVYLNGTTDYVEGFFNNNHASTFTVNSSNSCFYGHLVG